MVLPERASRRSPMTVFRPRCAVPRFAGVPPSLSRDTIRRQNEEAKRATAYASGCRETSKPAPERPFHPERLNRASSIPHETELNMATSRKPNILILWGDDIGYWNVSAYSHGLMGYKTPNIDRIAKEGALFTDWYGQQSCT